MKYCSTLWCISLATLISCNNGPDKKEVETISDSLTEVQRHDPANALRNLIAGDHLEVTTVATEPMLLNPTNIDVDEKGRIWVCEAYNYRPAINGNPTNAQGDRIVILEDNNGDGKADTAKVFYQGPELNAPLGISVLGNKVIISQSPYVWIFYDDNNDDKADRKEILFQGIGGVQHDHGIHSFSFGPDGKLYFNGGNEISQLLDKHNNPVRDQDGDIINSKKYKQGMVFRCNPDGSEVECLGQNFRNPYEVAVDSYGSLWQSDNDDDGNRGTRINYVMNYGNYGYTDEITGAGWKANRTNIEDSVPLRHWHLNDPGAVPNLLQTFAGSPAGILVYEGSLLPAPFQGSIIHADAGPNVVRAYPVKKAGAGFTATIVNILKDNRDQWFRPVDVCIAPDGSLIVADWYDPGVGGHAAGDQVSGRIYRVTPAGYKYSLPKQDYTTAEGAVAALHNPNLAVRYHAFTTLQQMGEKALPALETLWRSAGGSRMRARALWCLVKVSEVNAQQYIDEAIKDSDADLRITGLRAAVELNKGVIPALQKLVNDPDAGVLRECAIALHHRKSPEAAGLWATLAARHDGKDRWYLEALGIGADRQWDDFFVAWLAKVKDPLQSPSTRDIVWRARTDKAVPYIAALAADNKIPLHERLRYFRAFDFNPGPAKAAFLLKMIRDNKSNDINLNKLALTHLDNRTVVKSASAKKALQEVLRAMYGTDEYITLVARYQLKRENPQLLQLAINSTDRKNARNAAALLLQLGGERLIWNAIDTAGVTTQNNLIALLGGIGSKVSVDMLQIITLSKKYGMPLRKEAGAAIGKSGSGEDRVLKILKEHKVPAELIPAVVKSVSGAWREAVRKEAAGYLPKDSMATVAKKAITMEEIKGLAGHMEQGKKLFMTYCAACHQVNNAGYDFGPKLSEIGSKLPKENLLENIVRPSAGIGFGYEGWELKMKDGSVLTGIIASRTETDIDLRFPGGTGKQVKTADIKTITQMKQSMMPEGLYENMSTQDMADLLEYLAGLKKK